MLCTLCLEGVAKLFVFAFQVCILPLELGRGAKNRIEPVEEVLLAATERQDVEVATFDNVEILLGTG